MSSDTMEVRISCYLCSFSSTDPWEAVRHNAQTHSLCSIEYLPNPKSTSASFKGYNGNNNAYITGSDGNKTVLHCHRQSDMKATPGSLQQLANADTEGRQLKLDMEKGEKDRHEREKQRIEREIQTQERAKQERDKHERDRQERDRQVRDRQERERQIQERIERDRQERERQRIDRVKQTQERKKLLQASQPNKNWFSLFCSCCTPGGSPSIDSSIQISGDVTYLDKQQKTPNQLARERDRLERDRRETQESENLERKEQVKVPSRSAAWEQKRGDAARLNLQQPKKLHDEASTSTCASCFETCQMVNLVECGCSNSCLSCLVKWVNSQLEQGIKPSCICGTLLKYITVKNLPLGNEYKSMHHKIFVGNVLNNGFWCPTPDCGNDLHPGVNLQGFVICNKCQTRICCAHEAVALPQFGWANPHCCAVQRDAALRMADDMVKGMSKNCPKCLAPTQRDGGCAHMTCRCGYEYFWCCLRAYRDPLKAKEHFRNCS